MARKKAAKKAAKRRHRHGAASYISTRKARPTTRKGRKAAHKKHHASHGKMKVGQVKKLHTRAGKKYDLIRVK